MNLRKRWLAIAMTLFMTASLAPTGVFAASGGSSSGTAATSETQSAISAETYSELGLSRDVSGEDLMNEQQPYGKAEVGSTVATNVINELYVNFNGSIHYGWSILDDIPMKYRNGSAVNDNWTSADNSYGAMGYWRPNQNTVKFKNGKAEVGALYADGTDDWTTGKPNAIGQSINSANKHLTNQYNLAEAFSPGTGKDNYVAQLRVDYNNDVYLEIYKVSKKSDSEEEYDNTRVASKKIGNNDKYGGTRENTRIWNYEYDAMYDLAAGDMDGDGYDEIAVYFGNKIYLYTYKNNTLNNVATKETVAPDVQNKPTSKDDANKLASAIVKFAFGDFDADGKEELAAAQSMTYGAKNQADAKVEILKFENNTLTSDSSSISLSNPDASDENQKLIRYANVAAGDIDNDNIDELVIAGYSTNVMSGYNTNTCQKSNILYKVVDIAEISNNENHGTEWKYTTFNKKDILGRIADNTGQLVTPVSLACAATQGVGYADQIFMSGCLYSFDTTKNEVKYLTEMTTNREYKKDNGDKNNKSEIYVLNTVTGNFNGNEYGQEQIICVFAMKSDNSDNHWFDIAYINKDQPGDTDADDKTKYWYGQEQVMNQECSYNFTSEKTRSSLYLSLAAVDCDDDSTLMQYQGKNVTYTVPEVYTILQSSPYFEDIEENVGYLDESTTAYGITDSSGNTVTTGGSLSAGMYMSYEQDFSILGVKIASVEAEVQYKNTFSYDFEYEETVTESITYSAKAGDDYAVVYTVPYMEYNYKVWVPESKVPEDDTEWKAFLEKTYDGWKTADQAAVLKEVKASVNGKDKIGGYWDDCTIAIPMTPKTVILTVDTYDEIAEVTEGLEVIRGNILNSTPGSPETYVNYNTYGGTFKSIGKEQQITNAQGSMITIDGSKETVQAHNFSYEYEMEGKVGMGAGGLTVGVMAGFGFGVGGGFSNSNSKSYSGSVDNLPNDATNYSFKWTFGTREEKLNGNKVLILEYRTSGVVSPPSPPKELRVESVSTNSISLVWEASPGATSYLVYQVNPSTGAQLLMKTLPGSAESYVDDSVAANTSYTYTMRAIKGSESSIMSKQVTATTLSTDMKNFSITKQPDDVSTYATGDATFSLEAECLNSEGKPYTLHYQWEKYDESSHSWVECDSSVNGAPTYTATNVGVDDDGTKYRCLVYVNINLLLYSSTAELTIGKADISSIGLSAAVKSTVLNDGDYVKTAYTVTQTENVKNEEGQDEYIDVPVTKTVKDVECVEYTCVSTGGNEGLIYCYYNKDGNVYYLDESSINTSLTGEISELKLDSEKEAFSFIDDEGEQRTVSWSAVAEDTAYTAESKSFYMAKGEDGEERITDSSAKGAKEYKASEKYDITEEDGTTVSFYKCSYTDDENNTGDIWFVVEGEKTYTADLEESMYLISTSTNSLVSSMKFPVSALVMNTKPELVTQEVEETIPGETVTLTSKISSGQKKTPDGYVTFSIVSSDGKNSYNIRAQAGSDGTATCSWTPTVSGIYRVTAIYEGNDFFKSSSSKSMTINVVTPKEKKITLSASNMTYGDAVQQISLMLLEGTESGESSINQVAPATYTAKYSDGNAASSGVVSLASDGKTILFAPDKAGTYTITAEYTYTDTVENIEKTMTVTSGVTVYKRTATIIPDNINTQLNSSEDLTYTLEGVIDSDKELFKDKVTLSCSDNGNNATSKGEFTITAFVETDESITNKYNVVVKTGTCKVVEDAYKVYDYTDDANGTVKLTYTVGGVSLEFKSGDFVPKGATVTAIASPADGYAVKKWYLEEGDSDQNGPDQPVYIEGTNDFDKSNILVIKDGLDKSYSVKAEFELVYYELEYGIDDGTISAKYVTSSGIEGENFTSGSRLNPTQSIRFTATPTNGKSIKEWRVYKNNSEEYDVIKADNGTNSYTGNTYTVSKISAHTKIRIITEEANETSISVTFEDIEKNTLAAENLSVSFNNKASESSDGTFVYTGKKHDNVTIEITIPESLIVESWNEVTQNGNDKEYNVITGSDLKNSKKTYVISDLDTDRNIVVKCVAPNSYKVTYATTLLGKSSTEGGTVKVYKSGTANPLESDSSVAQASVLRIVAEPADGYDFEKLYVNTLPVVTVDAGNGHARSYTVNGVSGNIDIVADFAKRPVITLNAEGLENDDKATVTAAVNGSSIATLDAAGTVDYASNKDIVISAVAPEGYEVTGFIVGSSSTVEGGTANDSDNNRTYTVSGKDGITDDVTVTAKFRKLDTYTVEYSVIDTNGDEKGGTNGTISVSAKRKGCEDRNVVKEKAGEIEIYEGSTVTVKVSPDPGYRLKYLFVGDENVVSKVNNNEYVTTEIASAEEIKAEFELIGNGIYYSCDGTMGSLSAVYDSGDGEKNTFTSGNSVYKGTITFTAVPLNDEYRVKEWLVNDVVQSDAGNKTTFDYEVDNDNEGAEIKVVFEKSNYEITFNITESDKGSVTVNGKEVNDADPLEVVNGKDFKFKVTPSENYMIKSVSINDAEPEVSNKLGEADITIPDVDGDKTVSVVFAKIPSYTVTVKAGGLGSGTVKYKGEAVTAAGETITVVYGESITLEAVPDADNMFSGWVNSDSGDELSSAKVYTFKPSADIKITAEFNPVQRLSVSASAGKGGSIKIEGYSGSQNEDDEYETSKDYGSKVVFKAEPDNGKCVENWTVRKKSGNSEKVRAMGNVAEEPDIKYTISDYGTVLTIHSLKESVDVSVTFTGSVSYTISSVENAKVTDALGTEVTKVPRWGSADITVGKDYNFNKNKLKEAVGSNAEYSVVNNSDGSVTIKLSNIIGDIDTTSAFTKKSENTGGGGGGGGSVASEYTVKFVTGWFTKPADQKVAQGKKVTEPKLEDHGNYTLEGWYSDAEYTKLYSFNSAVKSDMTLYAKWKLNIGSEDEHACAAFADIAEHWAKDYICFAVESGLMNGVGEDRFAPDSLLSRGMLVTVLYRADGSPEIADSQQAAGFADVEDGKWYADAVAWASANGIVTGYTSADGSQQLFGPDNSITREQFAAIMYRYAKYKGCDIAEGGTEAQKYSDYGEISSYAKSAVEWAVSTGLITGVSDTRLAPQGSATRAQTAAILQRFAEKIM